MELTGARYGALGVLGEHGGLIHFLHSGMGEDGGGGHPPPPRGAGVLGTITRAGHIIRLDDVTAHPDAAGFPPGPPGRCAPSSACRCGSATGCSATST